MTRGLSGHRGVKRLGVVPRVSQASTVPAVEEGSRSRRESHIRRDEAVPSLKILGTPIGHEVFVEAQLMARIPAVLDLQAAWLLLSYCASASANFALRTVRPDLVGEFCASHDAAIWKCSTKILGVDASVIPDLTRRIVSLPFSRGGLGIQSASRTHPAAFWASWADGLVMVQQRHPEVAHLIISEMHHGTRSESIRGVVQCQEVLCEVGFAVPTWEALAEGAHPENPDLEDDSPAPRVGWQRPASSRLERQCASEMWPVFNQASTHALWGAVHLFPIHQGNTI